ncbi:hypothetical protein, partial [Ruminococcus sp.]|uniref:hypothetical protein n=1 Tax=Ruminococcus sp. TaxID=41978 RepID=UPI003AB69DD5
MRNEELWYRLSAINFLIGANAVHLLLVCQTCVIPHIWLQVLLPQIASLGVGYPTLFGAVIPHSSFL